MSKALIPNMLLRTEVTVSNVKEAYRRSERTALVNGLNGGTETRASVVQKIVDRSVVTGEGNQQFTNTYGQAFYNLGFNRAFVQLDYFG